MVRFCVVGVAAAVFSFALAAAISGQGFVSRRGFVTLQFDDGHLIHFTEIYPILEANGIKGTFAIVTESSELGIETGGWRIQEMYQAGHEIQDHTTRHDYWWATHVDTVDDGARDWIPYTFADVAIWDSLCDRSRFVLDSLGIQPVGWNEPGGGLGTTIPDHPGWSWLGSENDSLYNLIATMYSYAVACGPYPHTAHLNLRGHNCPDRYPFFNVPHVTIDEKTVQEIETGMADAAASGLWYLAVSHARNMQQVAKVESLAEWLAMNEIEVVKCCEGWQRLAYGEPDPLANQFPQADMRLDLDGNGKPDGFTGACMIDTVSATPVEGACCMQVFDQTEFFCYGPEAGTNALSLWMRYTCDCTSGVIVSWSMFDFEWNCLGVDVMSAFVDTTWRLIDSTKCERLVFDVDDEVDRIRVIIVPCGETTLMVAYPSLVLTDLAGMPPQDGSPAVSVSMRISPNPAVRGEAVRIAPSRPMDFGAPGPAHLHVYDIMGRLVLEPEPAANNDEVVIDTSELAPGVYLLKTAERNGKNSKMVILR